MLILLLLLFRSSNTTISHNNTDMNGPEIDKAFQYERIPVTKINFTSNKTNQSLCFSLVWHLSQQCQFSTIPLQPKQHPHIIRHIVFLLHSTGLASMRSRTKALLLGINFQSPETVRQAQTQSHFKKLLKRIFMTEIYSVTL